MKLIIHLKKSLPVLGAICLLTFNSQNTFASSSINSNADLLYTVNVTPQEPGSLNDLLISDSFEMLAPSESEPVSGIGNFTVTPNNLSTYHKQLTLVSDVQNGHANLSELGWIDLNFSNASLDTSYVVEVSLAYDLTSNSSANVAGGDFADTDILLNYYNDDNSFSGEDNVSSYANLSSQLGTILQSGSSGVFSFTLAPGASETFYTDVKMTANLEAVSAVPIPGAIWLFGSGLLSFVGLKKRQPKV
jgi:hypothetical protein